MPVPEIDWSAIDLVLLDMDGTLLDLRYDNMFWLQLLPQHYASRHGTTREQAVAELLPLFEKHRGSLQWYCVEFWSEQLDIDIVALKPELAHLIAWHPGARELLSWLGRLGKQRWLATNAHRASLGLKDQTLGLAEQLDRMISAHDIGHAKESPEFWQALRSEHGADLCRAMLVDDNLEALACAEAAGVAVTLAVSRPDSTQQPAIIEAFPSVVSLAELLPAAASPAPSSTA